LVELFDTASSTVLAAYPSLEEALLDVRTEIDLGGRSVARTWALGEYQRDGRIVCVVEGDALIERALAVPNHVAS